MTDRTNTFSAGQVGILIAIGAALWFSAALFIAAIYPLSDAGVLLLYAAIVPGTWPFVLLARKLAGLAVEQTVTGVAIATATASLCDGTALRFYPDLYGADTASAGAAILWGVGVALVLGCLMSRR